MLKHTRFRKLAIIDDNVLGRPCDHIPQGILVFALSDLGTSVVNDLVVIRVEDLPCADTPVVDLDLQPVYRLLDDLTPLLYRDYLLNLGVVKHLSDAFGLLSRNLH